MINKLKRRIFWIIQIPLSLIVIGMIILFTSYTYKDIISSSVMFMDRIDGREEIREENKNNKPKDFEGEKVFEDSKINNNKINSNDKFSFDIEGIYKLEIKENEITRESNDVVDEVRNYALEISKQNSEEGFIGNYVYKVRKFGTNVKEITMMENENAISRLNHTFIMMTVLGISIIVIIYIIAKNISKLIVKPVEESFEKQKQFVSDASHELKTPLAVIEANADVLQSKQGDSKWLGYIQNEVQSMNKLVNDLLVLAKMENTNTINKQKFNISKEVEMSVAVFESMIYEKNITLETNIDENIIFNGDSEDIKHIISILLDNAIKHTEKGNKIIVNFEKEKNDVKIEVKNQGEPIAEEDRERIFERFYRIDKARNRSEKRYGLGLSIAKSIVDKYKGTIKANSKDGYTSFVVRINDK